MDLEESNVDGRAYDRNATNVFGDADNTTSITDMEISFYDMSRDKYLFIFNHTKYQKTKYFQYQRPSARSGTEADVKRLQKLYKSLGYQIITYDDLEYGTILDNVIEISNRDHSNTSCLCFVFLTHGDKGGELFAADRPYPFRDVTVALENGHQSLVGKPKIFFIQACRGKEVDSGRRLELDGRGASVVIPSHADFLVLYSSVEDYVAYRDRDGSFLIQELCDVIEEYREEDILRIITLVHRRVAYHRSTYAPSQPSIHDKKQMPETRFSLTKLFKF